MSGRYSLVLPILMLGTAAVRADVVPPGTKPVTSKARFENLGDFPDYHFWVAIHPDSRFGPDVEKQRDKPFPVSGERLDPAKAEITLNSHYTQGRQVVLAVPKSLLENPEARPMSDWFDGKTPGILQANLAEGIGRVLEAEPRDLFWIVYRVEIPKTKAGEPVMFLSPVARDAPPRGEPHWLIAGGVGGAALLMIVGWLAFAMRRRGKQDTAN